MSELRRLPMCGMCGKGSTRLVQTFNGTFLLCDACEPPAQAGAAVAVEAMTPAPRFKLPPLPARKFNLPALPKRKSKPPTWTGDYAAPKRTVKCVVDYTYAENESGNEQECVVVECSECAFTQQSWGHGDKSVRRCLVLMGERCPNDADNFYILERDE